MTCVPLAPVLSVRPAYAPSAKYHVSPRTGDALQALRLLQSLPAPLPVADGPTHTVAPCAARVISKGIASAKTSRSFPTTVFIVVLRASRNPANAFPAEWRFWPFCGSREGSALSL